MTDMASLMEDRAAAKVISGNLHTPVDWDSPKLARNIKKRYAAERRFKIYGLSAIAIALMALVVLGYSIISKGYSAFFQTYVQMEIFFDPAKIDPDGTGDPAIIGRANFDGLIRDALSKQFPEVSGRSERRDLYDIVSGGASYDLRERVLENPSLIGQTRKVWLISGDDFDMLNKGYISANTDEGDRRLNDQEIGWYNTLVSQGSVEKQFHTRFFTNGDSREPELAGIWGAAVGSFYTLVVTLILSFPIGVLAAIYLEEFAPRNRFTAIVEVNINNLAAVPSIVFGLLGLEVYLNVMHLPRSAPVVGGLTLALMTLPTIIIASRAAIKAVPPSIRQAALGLGASPVQTVTHHVLPLAMPGILTGTIIGMAQALGETAPLLMIGMVAFIVDIPGGALDPATVLPVQIYLWADSPERAFVEKTSAAIMVLLGFLILMNGLAVYLRKKFERKW
ncbi:MULTISPECIES: phosphate ABC transporter permease PstA [Thalassospira]|uniref:Phosphate transport system permease protein PstA n=2 Tax=Thalassospira TaxID=168934 RepID=A0AB72UHD4_9PROT|nr:MULTISPECIES: phosphate ABC transporter permease PstA [Thalassospira]MBL4839420.1 phosphate ABC transporter permease PstA [Thalassospira sp.]MBR9778814.1 phosphate ABC transporter permease PstA [Rhodospirillales bacterium]AJD53673.1 phosphate ABC transporter permease [Thalassospira xiamenensis M-5 = DSM 17429]KEO59484.1 phosphate ABC transporter permease [Thalassospira permensis NBRC 106175]MBR9819304.1 phosphate ABC transporter permease PstA [Rhodospirillales bacterium]